VSQCSRRDDVIRKTRFVQQPFYRKVASFVEHDPTVAPFRDLDKLDQFDLVIVADYGHGLIPTSGGADFWPAKFLALTVQANSLNWGMNTLRKWLQGSDLDYIVLDEAELRLATQDAATPIRDLALRVALEYHVLYLAVTRGHLGCLVVHDGQVVEAPALAGRAVDRIGAGDAFLAMTAPLAKVGVSPEMLAFVGNIAGALQVERPGNKEPVTKMEIAQWATALLK